MSTLGYRGFGVQALAIPLHERQSPTTSSTSSLIQHEHHGSELAALLHRGEHVTRARQQLGDSAARWKRSGLSSASRRESRGSSIPSAPPGLPEQVITAAHELRAAAAGLAPAFAAARARHGLVALLFALAALAWWLTADRMRGMDEGPRTSGYLLTWSGAGLLAFGISDLGGNLLGDELVWNRAGRWVVGAILVAAALYELTPLKDVCLGKCRSPLGFLLGSWRGGLSGALRMGTRHGAWCVGCRGLCKSLPQPRRRPAARPATLPAMRDATPHRDGRRAATKIVTPHAEVAGAAPCRR